MNTTDPSAPTATVPCCGPRPICTVDGATPVSSLSMSLATTLTVTSCWPPWMSMSPSSSTATGGVQLDLVLHDEVVEGAVRRRAEAGRAALALDLAGPDLAGGVGLQLAVLEEDQRTVAEDVHRVPLELLLPVLGDRGVEADQEVLVRSQRPGPRALVVEQRQGVHRRGRGRPRVEVGLVGVEERVLGGERLRRYVRPLAVAVRAGGERAVGNVTEVAASGGFRVRWGRLALHHAGGDGHHGQRYRQEAPAVGHPMLSSSRRGDHPASPSHHPGAAPTPVPGDMAAWTDLPTMTCACQLPGGGHLQRWMPGSGNLGHELDRWWVRSAKGPGCGSGSGRCGSTPSTASARCCGTCAARPG